MGNGFSILIMLVVMMGLMFFMQRSQKKQADKRMESLNKLQKGDMKSLRLVACMVRLMKWILKRKRLFLM